MKNARMLIFAVLLLLLSNTAFAALVWDQPVWFNADGSVAAGETKIIGLGETARGGSGAFTSTDEFVYYQADLLKADGTFVKTLTSRTRVDVSTMMGYKRFEVAQADYVSSGNYYVKMTLSDSDDTEYDSLLLTVSGPANVCPVLAAVGNKAGREGSLLTFTVSATDADGNALSYSAEGLPEGASFDAASGVFTWTPGLDQAGSYSVAFAVSDGACADSETITITVADNPAPSVRLEASPVSGPEGTTVTFSCTASGGDTPYAFSIDFGDGESSSTSVATHRYVEEGNYDAVCTATDADGDAGTASVAISIARNAPVVDLVATPADGLAPLVVDFSCIVSGGNSPYAYVIDFGDGTFGTASSESHTYSSVGTYVATCTVVDYDGDVGSDTQGITVGSNSCPVLAAIGDKTVRVGEELSFTISATDADGDALAYSADAPFGLYIDSASGKFSWIPVSVQVGTRPATFSVSDGLCSDSETIIITVIPVTPGNNAPDADFTWSPASPEVGDTVTFTSTSTDADGDSLSCAWDFNNDGVSDASACTASYVFSEPGNHPVKLTVSDGELSDSETKIVGVVGQLDVESITCFDNVIEGSQQACTVTVKSNAVSVGGVDVRLHYSSGAEVTNCITDALTGSCVVNFPVGAIGTYTVYATAQKSGWLSDMDANPTETFSVLAKRYDISNLKVFNDPVFVTEDYDFFRGENMYVHFVVRDVNGNPVDDMITAVELVSPPGGRAVFTEFSYPKSAGNYYYSLRIPTTHEFLGDSQVFTFAFNFSDGSGAQRIVNVVIRNNLPVIDESVVGRFSGTFSSAAVINLTQYGSDVEDAASLLEWSVLGVDPSIAQVSVVNNVLTLTPVASGNDIFTLVLADLDGATDTVDVSLRTSGSTQLMQCADGLDNDGDGLVDMLDPGCSSVTDNDERTPVVVPVVPAPEKSFSDMDDLVVKRISMNGIEVEGAMIEAGEVMRLTVSLINNLDMDIENLKVEASIYELNTRSSGIIRLLDAGDTKSVSFNLDLPFDAAPGLYDMRFVMDNHDVKRVKYRTIEII